MGRSILVPPRLRTSDSVAIVASCSPFELENLERGEAFLRALGFFPQRSPNLFEKNGYLAGSDEDRASDLNQAFCDDAIRGIFLARGGYGSLRILDRLDPDTLFAHPKPLIGFSDATALAMYLFVHCGLITFSGPVGEKMDYYSLHIKIISRPFPAGLYSNDTGPLERLQDERVIETLPEDVTRQMRECWGG